MTTLVAPLPLPPPPAGGKGSILTASVDTFMEVVDRIPAEKSGIVTVDASTQGVGIAAGLKKKVKGGTLTGVGYAERKWGSKGWTAGGRGEFVF